MIGAGDRVTILGPPGSGKTTLLLLAGLEEPLATLDSDARADLRRGRLGITFHSFHRVPSLSALATQACPCCSTGRACPPTSCGSSPSPPHH